MRTLVEEGGGTLLSRPPVDPPTGQVVVLVSKEQMSASGELKKRWGVAPTVFNWVFDCVSALLYCVQLGLRLRKCPFTM